MPGLFSWKPRIRSRKTPEPERAQLLHQPPSSAQAPARDSKRSVRFDDDGVGRNRDPPKVNNEWQYTDELKVNMAPLAREEFDETKEERQPSVPRSSGSASAVLQQLREHDGALSDGEGTLRKSSRSLSSLGVVYLEVNDEVKRALLPPTVQSIDTVRALFLRSFPHLTAQYLNLPNVKIYIQEPSKGLLFYELDDLSDIKDRSVLRLREQRSGYQSPQPVRFTDRTPLEYVSESEVDIMDYRSRAPLHRMAGLRPSSALDNRTYGVSSKPSRSPIPSRFDTYYDPYSSDTSSQDARSGSVTPIIDKEARFRMETMERQLAGLSSLVHSALVSKGMSETSQRDMQELRKQILALHPDVTSGSSAPSSTEASLPDSVTSLSSEAQQQLLKLKRQTSDMHSQLKQMRRAVQVNTQNARDVLRDAFDRIQKYVAEHKGQPFAPSPAKSAVDSLKSEHSEQLSSLQKSLQSFEEEVEEVRKLVLNTNRKLRMTEVEQYTNSLTRIGRNAAKLKTQFPAIQRELESKIKEDMERILREEKFIKEESSQIDQCLRRCKTLANMMVTMKKLAMVQDPAVNTSFKPEKSVEDIRTKEDIPGNKSARNRAASDTVLMQRPELAPPPVPPSPVNYQLPSTSEKTDDTNVLDTILDELTSPPQRDYRNKSMSPTTVKNGPPKPPERRSASDLRSRYTPSQMQELQRRAMNCISPVQSHSTAQPPITFHSSSQIRIPSKIPVSEADRSQKPPLPIATTDAINSNDVSRTNGASSSESLNSQEGSQPSANDLEERQQQLAQKQRKLRSQFEQLQQMCPPSAQ